MKTSNQQQGPVHPKYQNTGPDGFYSELKQAVHTYFEERGISERGGTEIVLKISLLFFLYLGSYLLVLSNSLNTWIALLFAIVFGLTNVLIGFNIGHDAGHGALFASKRLNRIFSYSFDLVGVNAYSWDIMHNRVHHSYPNVPDYDPDIHYQAQVLRVSPTEPLKYYHRFQAYYAIPFYMVSTLLLVFVKEYQDMRLLPANDPAGQPRRKHSLQQYGIFFLSKLVYYTIWLIIPLLVLNVSISQFIIGFLIVHACMSLLTSAVLFTTHLAGEAPFAELIDGPVITESWAEHVFRNTVDFSVRSRLANFLLGGLNTHLIHHLLPGICHVHYRNLIPILEEKAILHGLKYRHVSMLQAVVSHLRFLKRMSVAEASPKLLHETRPAAPLA